MTLFRYGADWIFNTTVATFETCTVRWSHWCLGYISSKTIVLPSTCFNTKK